MTALNERLHAKGSSLDGWVEKNGHFSLSITEPVLGRLQRKTRLDGSVGRDKGTTVVKASVPTGVPRDKLPIIFGALGLVALATMLSGRLLIGLLIVPVAAAMYIPLAGDNQNSGVLVSEVQRTLKAKTTLTKTVTPKAAMPKKTTSQAKTVKSVAKAGIKSKSLTQRSRGIEKQRT